MEFSSFRISLTKSNWDLGERDLNLRTRISSNNSIVFHWGKLVEANPNIFIIVSIEIVTKLPEIFLVIIDLVKVEYCLAHQVNSSRK